MSEKKELPHSTKLAIERVGSNLTVMAEVAAEIVNKFNLVTSYECRISTSELIDHIIHLYPADISNMELKDDRIIEIVVTVASKLAGEMTAKTKRVRAAEHIKPILDDPPF